MLAEKEEVRDCLEHCRNLTILSFHVGWWCNYINAVEEY
jgi:hypothetical protein